MEKPAPEYEVGDKVWALWGDKKYPDKYPAKVIKKTKSSTVPRKFNITIWLIALRCLIDEWLIADHRLNDCWMNDGSFQSIRSFKSFNAIYFQSYHDLNDLYKKRIGFFSEIGKRT